MKNISLFCLTLEPKHENIIKDLSLTPVGLGEKKFSEKILSDKSGLNISSKNSFYGEYTFHYWIWKNYLDKIETEWVGFCQYRKFFIKNSFDHKTLDYQELKNSIINQNFLIDKNYDCVLGNKFSVENFKLSKIIKNHFLEFISNPKLLINKKKRNLKFHFDLFHGKGNLDKAINLLDKEDKIDFDNFMKKNNSFNPHNMFICKTTILRNYYDIIFPWLEKCEKIFGFNMNETYGLKRIYGFLAERFLPYWFNKNYNVKENPIIVKNITDYKNL